MKRLVPLLTLVFVLATTPSRAALTVGSTGTGIQTFGTLPAAGNWSTLSIAGGAADITTAAALTTRVQGLTAANVNLTLGTSATQPPDVIESFQWNSAGLFLQSRPSGVAFNVLMATLQNTTGAAGPGLTVSYTFGRELQTGATNAQEDVPGFLAFYSLTGASNSWQAIPALSTGNPGTLNANITLGSWANNSSLYLLWADDNGPASSTAPNVEGGYTIDNFSATVVIPEPSTGLLGLIGAAVLGFALRRRRSS